MHTRAYQFNCGQYVLYKDGQPTTKPSDTIALCIDKDSGVLHKHGDPERVRQWHATNVRALRQAGCADWADHMVVVEGRFPLEEINRCLSNTGYASTFFEKLQEGKISAIGYGHEAAEEVQIESPSPSP